VGVVDGGVEYAYRDEIDENEVWEVVKCSFQCNRVEYDWEKGMTFGVG